MGTEQYSGTKKTRLYKALEKLGVHDHLCLIYESREEQMEAAITFMKLGLERGEKCVYIADENDASLILESMSARGINVKQRMAAGALAVIGKRDAYLREGDFDPDRMISFLKETTENAKARGFKALRATGEMTWALGNERGVDRLIEYESKLNRFFPTNDALAICQYNRKRFPPETILDVIRTHPLVVHGNTVSRNLYYVPTDEFLGGKALDREIDRMLGHIKEREEAEERIRDKEERYRGVLDSTSEGFWMLDAEGKAVEVNDALCRMLGYPREELAGRIPHEFMENGQKEEYLANYARLGTAGHLKFESAFLTKSGEKRDVIINASTIMGKFGMKRGSFALVMDITDRKRAENAIRAQKDLLDSINRAQVRFIARAGTKQVFEDLLTDTLRFTRSEYGFIAELLYGEAGKPFLRTITFSGVELLKSHREFFETNRREIMDFTNLNNLFGAVITSGKTVIANDPQNDPRRGGRMPHGHPPLNAFIGIPLYSGDMLVGQIGMANRPGGYDQAVIESLQPLLATCANLVEAHKNARKLEATEAERDRVFNISMDLMCIVGFDGYFKRINPAFEKTLGYSSVELISKPFMDFIHPEDRERSAAEAKKVATGEPVVYFENRYVCKDGTVKWLAWSAIPFPPEGVMYAVARDMTERKRFELELLRSNKELEQMAYVASHDMQEPLRMVASFMQLLARRYKGKLDKDADDYITYAIEGAQRMQGLIQDLLRYSRVTTRGMEPFPTDSGKALDQALLNLQLLIEDTGARITRGPLPFVLSDANQLVQVFQNLVANAIKFRGEAPPAIRVAANKKEGMVIFSVGDNGIGIEERHWERIFAMFQRLHPREQFEGTGIGLAICKKIVERHGGRIWLESQPGSGSTFYFSFPGTEKEGT